MQHDLHFCASYLRPPRAPPSSLQTKQLQAVASKHAKRLPDDLDYSQIHTLSMEAREKLARWGRREHALAGGQAGGQGEWWD